MCVNINIYCAPFEGLRLRDEIVALRKEIVAFQRQIVLDARSLRLESLLALFHLGLHLAGPRPSLTH